MGFQGVNEIEGSEKFPEIPGGYGKMTGNPVGSTIYTSSDNNPT